MAKRTKVILPEDAIDLAAQLCLATSSARTLQERLEQAAIRDRDFDLGIAQDWFAVDPENG
jgi:hypothetical protein